MPHVSPFSCPGLDAANAAGRVAESVGTPSYRMTGLTLQLQIAYTNLIRLDGEEVRATISVQKMPLGWSGLGPSTDYVDVDAAAAPDGTPSRRSRRYSFETLERYSYGTRVVVSTTGEIGDFDLYNLLAILSQFIVYMGLAAICGEVVAHYFLGDKGTDYFLDQFDFSHSRNKPPLLATRSASRRSSLDAPDAPQAGDGDGDPDGQARGGGQARGWRISRLASPPAAPPPLLGDGGDVEAPPDDDLTCTL